MSRSTTCADVHPSQSIRRPASCKSSIQDEESLVPQWLARSLLFLWTRGYSRENCLSLPRSLARVYRENVHSSVDRRDYGQFLSRLPQRSTALDGLPGQLNVVRTYHNSLSEPFRRSGLREPGPISSNQVLAQQDGLAERWRDRDRAGSFALTEGWQDRLRDRNAGERTSVERFVEFHVFNSHGSRCAGHRLREGQNYEPAS